MVFSNTRKILIFVAASLPLTGCGGGSGGPGGSVSFTQFPLQAGKTTTIKGSGREATYTAGQQGISISPFGAASSVQADVETDSGGDVASLTVKTNSMTKTWNGTNSEITQSGNGKLAIAQSKDDTGGIGYADPEANGFSYQTYGAWQTASKANSGSVGAFSLGNETAAANIPSSSTATFKGTAGGLYANAENDDIMTADATLDVDFGTKTAQFSTSNTVLQNSGAAANLNMSGNMDIGAGGLSGTVATADNLMTGTADGRFYGPGAEEAGGTFALGGATGAMVGGYGVVKQQP